MAVRRRYWGQVNALHVHLIIPRRRGMFVSRAVACAL